MSKRSAGIFKKVIGILKDFPEIQLAIVYGSFAQDTYRPESDLDLAVAGRFPLPVELRVDLITRLSTVIGREVDLIDLNEATGTILKEAIGKGKVIIKKDSLLLARILSRLLSDQEDFQKMRSRFMSDRRKKVFGVA